MTYPSEFRSSAKTVGSSAIKHPIYTFRVNLDLYKTESIGPNTNQREVTVLHPDSYVQSPDYGRTLKDPRNLHRISWIPGMLAAGNLDINDDGTITAYGQQGKYLLDTYTTGTNPLLTLTNSAPYTSA